MSYQTLTLVLTLVGAVAVLVPSFWAVCDMDGHTHHGIRLAFFLVTVGSFGEIAALVDGHIPGTAECLFVMGVAILQQYERRTPLASVFHRDHSGHPV